MEKSPILFMSPTCPACIHQKEVLAKYSEATGKPLTVYTVNIDNFPNDFPFVKSLPTWIFPTGDGKNYKVRAEIIENPNFSFGARKRRGRKSRFGETLLPNINNLAVYGKNFPNGEGFNISESYSNTIEKNWGTGTNALNAGVGGTRSLGPENIGEMYSNEYVNNIRMAHPADQLGTALYLNRSCNTDHKPSTMENSPGMIYNASNPQIVDNNTGFGKRNKRVSRFGKGLYSQMGPAYEIGNQYLINQNTGQQLYSGGRQNDLPRPYGIENKTIYVGQAPLYNPIGDVKSFSFGKRVKTKVKPTVKSKVKPKVTSKKIMSGKKAVNIKISIKRKSKAGTNNYKIGEGSTLILSKKSKKIKVKN